MVFNNKTPKHQNLVTENQILAPFDLSLKQIKNQFSNFWNRDDESEGDESEGQLPF